jgi:hypothetical protein
MHPAAQFSGSYTVSQGSLAPASGLAPALAPGDKITIGQPTTASGTTNQLLEVTVYDRSDKVKIGPAQFLFQGASLWCENVASLGVLYRFFVISLYVDPGGSGYQALYGVITQGDPQQVGVWGAEQDGAGTPREMP